MQTHFEQLVQAMPYCCPAGLGWSLFLQAEASDFVRFNHAAIRQAGHLDLAQVTVRLIDGRRHASRTLAISGQFNHDKPRLQAACAELQALLPSLPDDPYLALNEQPQTSCRVQHADHLDAQAIARDIVRIAHGHDLVGLLSVGPMMSGCANHHGVRHWNEVEGVVFDFSLHRQGNRAVKAMVAGRVWSPQAFEQALARAHAQLAVFERPLRTIEPGRHRVFLAPAAVGDLLDLMQWGGFSAKEQATKRSSLQKLVADQAHFHPQFSLSDDLATGYAPAFDSLGFARAGTHALIKNGRHANAIVSARTAAEYGLTPTGADDELAVALSLAPGELPMADAAAALGDGLYINNLWYLNYSDRANARATGMTRFATLWVENGVAVAACEPMRFDASYFDLFGEALQALTRERELIVDTSNYGFRSTNTVLAPGALIAGMDFTL